MPDSQRSGGRTFDRTHGVTTHAVAQDEVQSSPVTYAPPKPASAADAARAGFDDAFLYDELRKDPSQRKLRSMQLLGEEAWSSFAAWIATPDKIEY